VLLAWVFGVDMGIVGFVSIGFVWLGVSLSGWVFVVCFGCSMMVLIVY